MMDESKEMDERCLALLHAARIGDPVAVRNIAQNISYLYAYANKPSRRGIDDVMQVLMVAYDQLKGYKRTLKHLVSVNEAADYEPAQVKVINQEKAEAAYQRWRHEKRPA